MIKKVMGIQLIKPDSIAIFRFPSPDTAGPLVIPRSQFRVPRARIARAIKNVIKLRVIRDPAPDGAAANLPLVGRPRCHSQVLPLLGIVKRFELLSDEAVLVWPSV